jgi:hypothetical protein
MNKIFEKSKEAVINKSFNIWENSEFNFLISLAPDEKGYWGEDTFQSLARNHTTYSVIWDGDNNTNLTDGIYDMKINSKRTEQKTAMKGTKSDTWQHDHIKEDSDFDKLVFFDISPDNTVFVTIISDWKIKRYEKKHPIFKKKASPCKGGWKFDMSKATIKRGIKAGLTYHFDANEGAKNVDFDKFLMRHFL